MYNIEIVTAKSPVENRINCWQLITSIKKNQSRKGRLWIASFGVERAGVRRVVRGAAIIECDFERRYIC